MLRLQLLFRCALAGVLVFAAASKLASPRSSRAALATFGLGGRGSWPAWAGIVATELGLAAGVALGSTAAAFAAAGLLLAFAGALALALRRGRAGAPCACFGSRSRVSLRGVGRNVALALAFGALPFVPAGSLTADGWLALGLAGRRGGGGGGPADRRADALHRALRSRAARAARARRLLVGGVPPVPQPRVCRRGGRARPSRRPARVRRGARRGRVGRASRPGQPVRRRARPRRDRAREGDVQQLRPARDRARSGRAPDGRSCPSLSRSGRRTSWRGRRRAGASSPESGARSCSRPAEAQ